MPKSLELASDQPKSAEHVVPAPYVKARKRGEVPQSRAMDFGTLRGSGTIRKLGARAPSRRTPRHEWIRIQEPHPISASFPCPISSGLSCASVPCPLRHPDVSP